MIANKPETRDMVCYENSGVAHLNVFRPVQKGKRPKAVKVTGTYDGVYAEVKMWEQLCFRDQDLYLLLCFLASHKNHSAVERADATSLVTDGDYAALNTLRFGTSLYHLAKELYGTRGGSSYQAIRDSLVRLSDTTIYVGEKKNSFSSTSLIGVAVDENGTVSVALNPLSAMVLLGKKVGYVRYNLRTRYNLPLNNCRLLLSILTNHLRKDKGSINFYFLLEKFYGTHNVGKDKKQSLKKHLSELNELTGWNIYRTGRGNREIVYFDLT